MQTIYLFILLVIGILAIIDLVVGVSNDAVNFLNAAIGSKTLPFKRILLVASIGIGLGVFFSSGVMPVARKGVFSPEMFTFAQLMIVFISVMFVDVILIDIFNTLGLPTSTTVSVVFELLGAAFAIVVLQTTTDVIDIAYLSSYIHVSKALFIIVGIVVSVFFAFIVGALVQYISRLIFTFKPDTSSGYLEAVFGGFCITVMGYFMLLKGISTNTEISSQLIRYIYKYPILLFLICFVGFALFSWLLLRFTKVNIFKLVIVIGTFTLAVAFAGNDLVNFIGVPIAAYKACELWLASGVSPDDFYMTALSDDVSPSHGVLLLSGIIMILTLWYSKKARVVINTQLDLARQGVGQEKFQPNAFSRILVRQWILMYSFLEKQLPRKTRGLVQSKFNTTVVLPEGASFDVVRASVNLVIASMLILLGTSLKMPLSTTYVTFMVAMGSSLADRAWGRESAVYRVAGVFTIILGWFATALLAFLAALIVAAFLWYTKEIGVVVLLLATAIVLFKNYRKTVKRVTQKRQEKKFASTDLITISEMITESSDTISLVMKQAGNLYSEVVTGLSLHEVSLLKKNTKILENLEMHIDVLRGDVFYFIKSLDTKSVAASRFYILILDALKDTGNAISSIIKKSHLHVDNNHNKLRFNQIRDLKSIDKRIVLLFEKVEGVLSGKIPTRRVSLVLEEQQEVLSYVNMLLKKQIDWIRAEETSPKNTELYFNLLLDTKDLVQASIHLINLYKDFKKEYNTLEEPL